MELDMAVLSKQGGRPSNEDACGYRTSERRCCWVVSDGAGGHGSGDVASKTVVKSILRDFAGPIPVSAEGIRALLARANSAVLRQQDRHSRLSAMRATVAVLEIDLQQRGALWGHLGDTRVYSFRNGRILSQTRDHSVIQTMVDAGYSDGVALREHPRRNVLLYALGSDDDLLPSVCEQMLPIDNGDVFLLCTDGLWEYVTEEAMERELAASSSARRWLEALERELLAHAGEGHDNYSAIAVWVGNSGDATRIV
jgi:serine/threonine protein phosphatase PrpC